MSDTSPLPLDPTDPHLRPPRPVSPAVRDARHLGAADDASPPPTRPTGRRPLVPTRDPYAGYGVRDELPEDDLDVIDPDEVVVHARRRVHRPTSDDAYRLSYAGTTGLCVVLGVGVLLLVMLLVWTRG